MLQLIQSINIKIAGYLGVFMVVIIMISHGLVILKVIPYTWINGEEVHLMKTKRNNLCME
ncbi:hypothetical protein [Paraclostridium sordellii]|uniref:hypothetical protein n=1 Tax=Paraclostridium sordellii TaxID=1505 RepID=UPI0005DCAB04|nr:hypothetical protein [Paeniclostridium sordellii]CEP40602.1 Uncharacterised protein [[Clostridium] sordellii] [Paeniclostridium sordellii]